MFSDLLTVPTRLCDQVNAWPPVGWSTKTLIVNDSYLIKLQWSLPGNQQCIHCPPFSLFFHDWDFCFGELHCKSSKLKTCYFQTSVYQKNRFLTKEKGVILFTHNTNNRHLLSYQFELSCKCPVGSRQLTKGNCKLTKKSRYAQWELLNN